MLFPLHLAFHAPNCLEAKFGSSRCRSAWPLWRLKTVFVVRTARLALNLFVSCRDGSQRIPAPSTRAVPKFSLDFTRSKRIQLQSVCTRSQRPYSGSLVLVLPAAVRMLAARDAKIAGTHSPTAIPAYASLCSLPTNRTLLCIFFAMSGFSALQTRLLRRGR